jgi:hypothetical protein
MNLGCSNEQHSSNSGAPNNDARSMSNDPRQTSGIETDKSPRITEAEAVEIAVKKYADLGNTSQVESSVVRATKDGYVIQLEKVPPSLGGHCEIIVQYDGTVSKVNLGR